MECEDMPITLLDGILVGFTLVSAMLAMVRGFSREILSIASWAAAAAAAFFFYPPVLPYVQPYIDNDQIAMAAAAGVVFVVALIVVTLITMKIADLIIDSRDRRARPHARLPLRRGARHPGGRRRRCCSSTGWSAPSAPAWVANAKSRPLLESIGTKLESLLPDDPENSILKRFAPGDDAADPDAPAVETPPAEAPAEQPPAVDPEGTPEIAPSEGPLEVVPDAAPDDLAPPAE